MAHILLLRSLRDHISPKLASLQWLPVKSRSEYKKILFTYKDLHGKDSYLKELIISLDHIYSAFLLCIHLMMKVLPGNESLKG